MRIETGFKIAIVVIPVLTGLVLIPAARLTLIASLGRTNQCSFSQAVNSFGVLRDRKQRSEEIRASARLLQSDGAYDLWRTRDGDFWTPQRNSGTLPLNLAEQEQDVYGTGLTGLHSGDIVLDCGANVGVYTRKALNAGARTVVAIEPAPENVECLRRNFAKEIETGRVLLQPVGVWNQRGELPLNVDVDNSARDSFVITFRGVTSTVTVPLVTIDSLVNDLALPSVNFIKMDIEGAEKNAITGAANVMARFRPRLAVATEHLSDDPVAIPAMIDAMGLGYATICGPCIDERTSVRPDVLYFVPR
jgi:FkbM family methyltransferase